MRNLAYFAFVFILPMACIAGPLDSGEDGEHDVFCLVTKAEISAAQDHDFDKMAQTDSLTDQTINSSAWLTFVRDIFWHSQEQHPLFRFMFVRTRLFFQLPVSACYGR